MSAKPIKVPGPQHPITLQPSGTRVTARIAGRAIADSASAIILTEAGYPGVAYFPRADVDMAVLERTDHATYCPYKGDASYFSIRVGDELHPNAVWTYEDPYPAVAEIKEYVAFYPDRVEISTATA